MSSLPSPPPRFARTNHLSIPLFFFSFNLHLFPTIRLVDHLWQRNEWANDHSFAGLEKCVQMRSMILPTIKVVSVWARPQILDSQPQGFQEHLHVTLSLRAVITDRIETSSRFEIYQVAKIPIRVYFFLFSFFPLSSSTPSINKSLSKDIRHSRQSSAYPRWIYTDNISFQVSLIIDKMIYREMTSFNRCQYLMKSE